MRPPGSNYKNYCSSKLLMSCDVLPTCEEGLGVEKACYPDDDVREGAPTGPALLSHPGKKGSVYPDHKSKQEKKTKDTQLEGGGGGFLQLRTGSRLERSFPQR